MVFTKSPVAVLAGVIVFLALAAVTANLYTGDPDGAQVKINKTAAWSEAKTDWEKFWSVTGPWLTGKTTETEQTGASASAGTETADRVWDEIRFRLMEGWTKSHVYGYLMLNIREKIKEEYQMVINEYRTSDSNPQ